MTQNVYLRSGNERFFQLKQYENVVWYDQIKVVGTVPTTLESAGDASPPSVNYAYVYHMPLHHIKWQNATETYPSAL